MHYGTLTWAANEGNKNKEGEGTEQGMRMSERHFKSYFWHIRIHACVQCMQLWFGHFGSSS